jgi:hypothetical protein
VPLALSVICRIYILRSPVKILFCLVSPIVFSFRANPFFYLVSYTAEHGMILIWKYRIEVSMFTAICTLSFGMDQNCTVYLCKYWVALNPGLGGVGSNMHFYYCLWTGSIKPIMQYFHICRVRWLSNFPFHLYLKVLIDRWLISGLNCIILKHVTYTQHPENTQHITWQLPWRQH